MTTASVKSDPRHYEAVLNDAAEIGWEVVRHPGSIKISPPSGVKGARKISLPRVNPLAPPQLKVVLKDHGFTKALEAHRAEQPPEAPKAAEAGPGGGELVCPDCVAKGVEKPFTSRAPQGMGAHRRRVHGVPGTSKKAVAQQRAAKAAGQKPGKAAPKAKVPAQQPRQPEPASPAGSTKVQAAIAALVHAVGSEVGDVAALREENQRLRTFKDQVVAEASNGNRAPFQVVANILDLAKAVDQQ